MRLAFIDLVFSWPPHGGADVDLFRVLEGLQRRGHDVHLFVGAYEGSWECGDFEPHTLPFPSTRLKFGPTTYRSGPLSRRFRQVVDAWGPDAAVICDGFFLKTAIISALAHYPTVARYYAYEVACMRDILLFKDGAPCPNNYLRTPNECRKCALEGMKAGIKRWRFLAQTHELLGAGALFPSYHRRLTEALKSLDAVIVSNQIMRGHLEGFNENVVIFPAGVDLEQYPYAPQREKTEDERKVIFMSGRVEDPMKGLETLRLAGEKLAEDRSDFEIWATHTDQDLDNAWFRSVGWHPSDKLLSLYQQSDICVMPSIWEEPYGLVAIEAMACGRPVCASRVGGLQDIVKDGETGFLFSRQNSGELAEQLARLLDDQALRMRMGEAGRKQVELEHDNAKIVSDYYEPLLEELTS